MKSKSWFDPSLSDNQQVSRWLNGVLVYHMLLQVIVIHRACLTSCDVHCASASSRGRIKLATFHVVISPELWKLHIGHGNTLLYGHTTMLTFMA